MEIELFDTKVGTDRFATSDEVRAALCFLPDHMVEVECENDEIWEVDSDLGGRVLVRPAEVDEEALILLEKLDATPN